MTEQRPQTPRASMVRKIAAQTGRSFADVQRELREAAGADGPPGTARAIARKQDLEGFLKEAVADIASEDPFRRQAALDLAGRIYLELTELTTGDVETRAFQLAALHYKREAARVRFHHGIPTIYPTAELELLQLAKCDGCGRPWQLNADGACEHCPQLLWGPAPSSQDEAGAFPPGKPVTPAQLGMPN